MRQDSDGREAVPVWSDPLHTAAPPYAIRQRVFGAIDGVAGTVLSVDTVNRIFSVQWCDAHAVGDVTYPFDTVMVRRAFPWENCDAV